MSDAIFDWDVANIGHIAEHQVTPEEAEEVILNEPLDLGFEVIDGEQRWSHVGETNAGRILRVVMTLRGVRIRVVTAFDPPKRIKKLFLAQKAGPP